MPANCRIVCRPLKHIDEIPSEVDALYNDFYDEKVYKKAPEL